jgi:very-short-patch-repair endonuclease
MVTLRVKQLRTNMTDAERRLWRVLWARSLGSKFRRQVPLGPYVVDFVCFQSKVIVELDGSQHADSKSDMVRDQYFKDRGYRLLRFWNSDVMNNQDGILQRIVELTDPSPGAPLRGAPPSPSRGEGKRKAAP